MLAGRAEAARLGRNPLVLVAVLAAAALIWSNSRTMVPQWWVWDVQIGRFLLFVAGAALIAAQLAAGRARRDGLASLYASYPAPASARAGAWLLGVAGPLLLAAALTGAAVLWLDLLGPVGTPRLAVLFQGLLLVALGGATGVAVGSWLPGPMAGIVAAIVLGAAETDVLIGGPVQLPGGTAWLFPWSQPVILPYLPGPTSLIPPAAHLAWLAALTGLAAAAAAWRASPRRGLSRLTGLTALATAGCLGVAGWSGWTQTRPVPRNVQASLIYQATHPATAERCTGENGVRYCAYPGFRPDVTRWATAVNGVLARLPSRAARPLVVRQVVDTYLYTPPMTVGFEPTTPSEFSQLFRLAQPLGRFLNAQGSDPYLVPGSSVPPVYVDMNWGAGAAVGVYQLSLAMQTAWWVAGLPTSGRTVQYPVDGGTTQEMISCLPVGQAREAIALWLATSATPAGLAAFRAGLTLGYQPIARVRGTWVSGVIGVPTLAYAGYLPALQFTQQGSMLAQAMLRLPEREVRAVLAARWPGWLSPRATDAQLAAALRIPLPAAVPPPASQLSPGQPPDPVCR